MFLKKSINLKYFGAFFNQKYHNRGISLLKLNLNFAIV